MLWTASPGTTNWAIPAPCFSHLSMPVFAMFGSLAAPLIKCLLIKEKREEGDNSVVVVAVAVAIIIVIGICCITVLHKPQQSGVHGAEGQQTAPQFCCQTVTPWKTGPQVSLFLVTALAQERFVVLKMPKHVLSVSRVSWRLPSKQCQY